MQLYTRILKQSDLERNLKFCCKQCRFYRLYKTQMYETHLGSWSFPMLLVTQILQNVQTLSTKSETYTIRGVYAPLCGLHKRARHKRHGCFFRSGWKLAGSRLTYSWLWFRPGKTNFYLTTSSPLRSLYVFFSMYQVFKCELPIYRQYVSTNRHVKYSCTACGLFEYLLKCLNHPGIAVIVWS